LRVFILKPDAIGDFILASGCIRLIAREEGEENLVLAVRSDVASLAQSQFPKAKIIPLPLREVRRIVNVATVNVINCLPSWLRMASMRVDTAICLRSMRAYLHTIFFYTPRARRRIACENLLLADPRVRRPAVENFVRNFFKPTLLPYPAAGDLPTDIEANKIVTAELLGREMTSSEILPRLIPPRPIEPSTSWLLCPFSSKTSKDYPAEAWAEAIKLVEPLRNGAPLHLAAGPEQRERLEEFAATLRSSGVDHLHIDAPVPLSAFLQNVAEAKLILTVDTAAAHMACALGTRAIVVSAGKQPGVYAPYSPNGRQTWLLPPRGLSKGEWRQHITPKKIAAAIEALL
jgi:hypothetical protein